MQKNKITVVGGGPAGMMAAIRAGELSCEVVLIEKKSRLGNKLLLSGKGRCNLTNYCELDAFLKRFSKNGEFLRDAFSKFFNKDLIEFFQKRGLQMRIERQMRVFPQTDSSSSILKVLESELKKKHVGVFSCACLESVVVEGGAVKGVLLKDGRSICSDKLILATGGASYSFTGSSGEGIEIARRLGHRIVQLGPGLVPLEVRGKYPALLEGLALKNIRLKFSCAGKEITSEIGELLFTNRGVSGPLVISLSARIGELLKKHKQVMLFLDLKPALSREQLSERLIREFDSNARKSLVNCMHALMPKSLSGVFLEIAGIPSDKKAGQATRQERLKIASFLKVMPFEICATGALEQAMVTIGGVSLKDINPRTMESRVIKGLYFAGEMIDVDADTGGFNLQAAFSTGYLAGESAAQS